MNPTVTPTQSQIYSAVRAFVQGALPTDAEGDPVPVIQGLGNRTSMPPANPGFVVMTGLFQSRLRTNIDTWDTTDPNASEQTVEQGIHLRMQLDCYGPSAGDWAATLSTLWRDDYGCNALAPNCQPLHADEPRMMPLVDEEQQYEQRWLIDASLQFNADVTIPQQFAVALKPNLINVDEAY